MTCNEPMKSQGRCEVAVPAGISQPARGRASSTMGTLIRNTEPHQKYSSSSPLTTGPKAAPPEATEAQMPMASARSRSSAKLRRIRDSVAGIIMAAPTPSSARAAISKAGEGDRKSTRLNSSHLVISYAVFCLQKKKKRTGTHDLYGHD